MLHHRQQPHRVHPGYVVDHLASTHLVRVRVRG